MHRSRCLAAIAIALLLPATGSAVYGQPAAAKPAAAKPDARVMTGTVTGTAWRGDTTPFPQAKIRLRDVHTGRGVAQTVTNVDGRFTFERVNPGAYVVELLSPDGKVLAVGDLFGVTAGGRAVTLVRLSAKAPWFGGFFGNAAAAAIAAASTLGVTATGSSGRPASPQ